MLSFISSIMKDRPLTPEEFPGTSEYWELQSDKRARINMQLDIEQEQIDYELVPYPYRYSH